jgi:DNA polymerase III epsilon subunit-like protein
MRICAIGAARFELGCETRSYRSLVQTRGPIRFTRIHGLTSSDLAGAPPWPAVWNDLLDVLADIDTVVAFRASFDRGAILVMCANYGIRLPRLRFVCAAALMQARSRSRLGLSASLEVLGLPFPGRPHEPLADARAAALIALACAPPRVPPA